MKSLKLSVVLQLVLIFLGGVGVGALGFQFYNRKVSVAEAERRPRQPGNGPSEIRKRYVNEMKSRLHLSDAQVQQLNTIMDATRRRFGEVRRRAEAEVRKVMDPEMDAIHKDQVSKIESMLEPGQLDEYHKMLKEREQAHRRRSGRSDRPLLPQPRQ